MNKERRKFWTYPWGYRESFTIAFAILLVGFLIEYLSPVNAIFLPRWPYNLLLIIVFLAYVALSNRMVKHPIIKWLSGVPAAISSISVMTLLVLLMGFIPQSSEPGGAFISDIGLTHVIKSWPYLLISFYLLVILAFTIMRRILPFKVKNIAFTLNHAGLWIVVAAASLGSADMKKFTMQLVEDKAVFTAYDKYGQPRQMNFAVKLLNFHIKEYPPSIGLLNEHKGELKFDKKAELMLVEEQTEAEMDNWKIRIAKYYEAAVRDTADGYIPNNRPGASALAYVVATNLDTGAVKEGWVTNGSFMMSPKYLRLGDGHSVVMTVPRPKEYSSDFRFFRGMEDYEDVTIKVNKPATIDGWTFYQTGYNEKMGKWSQVSIVEIVKDPWLPVVYTGIFMILLGSLYLVWMGRTKNAKKQEEDDLV
ncbi:MAG: cytochrome c biogenesis protein ResB [Bacteroidales bacterium]|nr:cytochrome c biogenesis protein ResB [Bacteroidales bacterium]MCF8343883.1 cytochrome c biogenesis protein ResB [Bacteroidales bacterium]MCF8377765.1 cytochrome c biogenesis protein ResB [Bacteroidales bacterium]